MINEKIIFNFEFFLICTACATPTVVNVIGSNDEKLNCKELSNEIIIANQYLQEAQEAKKMSKPHNIAAVIFFLPAAFGTVWNVDEASTAAKKEPYI